MELKRNATVSNVYSLAYIPQKVLDIIKENLVDQSSTVVSIDSPFPEVNSITFIKIVVTLENEFNFEFDDEMLLITKFPTIKEMVEYVESKVTTSCKNE